MLLSRSKQGSKKTSALKANITLSTPDDTDTICAVVARCFRVPRNQVTAKTSLVDDLGCDSIDLIALAVDLEEEFNVVIPDQVLCRIRTIGDAVPCITNAVELRRISREAASLDQTMDDSVT